MKRKNKINAKRRFKGDTLLGREILASLHEVQDTLESGRPFAGKYTIDVVDVPEPRPYGPKQIRTLRAKLGLSQAVFAGLIGASVILVQKWEGGDRRPDGMARRLMDDINADPERFLSMLLHRKKAG